MFSKFSNKIYTLMGVTKSVEQEPCITSISDIELNDLNKLHIKPKPDDVLTKFKSQVDNWIDSNLNIFKKNEPEPNAPDENHQKFTIKSLGESLQTTVTKAERIINETGRKIRRTIEQTELFTDFLQKHDDILQPSVTPQNTASPPWIGASNEQLVKEQCLNLSYDRRNFIKGPPPGVNFNFDYKNSYPIAIAILKEDPNLNQMRYDLVPKILDEETFWENYFYRISLICNANELENMSKSETKPRTSGEHFVSDYYEETVEDLEYNKNKLDEPSKKGGDEELNRELEEEFNDFESTEKTDSEFEMKNEFWEKDIETESNESGNYLLSNYEINDLVVDNMKILDESPKNGQKLEEDLIDFEGTEQTDGFEVNSEFWEKDIDEMFVVFNNMIKR